MATGNHSTISSQYSIFGKLSPSEGFGKGVSFVAYERE